VVNTAEEYTVHIGPGLDQPVVEMSHSDLLLSHETGQTGGEQPVHPHDKEVSEDVGEGEVERDVVHPGVCWQ